jgi:2-(1,2-epoxy-1,2-dihydrophenyl)acetyl-CoA isomerase
VTVTENVRAERAGGVLTLTLDRPEKLNAMTYPMIDALLDALDAAKDDPGVRAVVLRGEGRAFCAGDDVTGMGEPRVPPPPGTHLVAHMQQRLIKQWYWLRKPTIAAVQGRAHGIGHDLVLAADFRVLTADAILGDIRARRAVPVGSGGTFLLPLLVGLPTATRIMLTGGTIDAAEANLLGLATKIVAPDELGEAASTLAEELAAAPTKALGILKTQMRQSVTATFDEALATEIAYLDEPVEDRKEGIASFAEKRAPVFTGR